MSASSDYMAEPPAGELRHTADPPSLHRELAAAAVSTSAVALVAVVLRLFTTARVTRMGIHLNDCKSPQSRSRLDGRVLLTFTYRHGSMCHDMQPCTPRL